MLELYNDPAQLPQTVDSLRKRVAEAGDRYTTIEPRSDGRIEVRAPGISDPTGIARYLTRPGVLSFHLVDPNAAFGAPNRVGLPGDRLDGPRQMIFADAIVTNDDLIRAEAIRDELGHPAIAVELNPAGAKRFGLATGENVGGSIAIVLDGRILSSPVIRAPITDGSMHITGGFTSQEAEDLACILRTGPLPAHLRVAEVSTFGTAPS